MEQRINLQEKGQNAMKSLYGLSGYLNKSTLEKKLLHLIYFRVSQINGCAFCLDMHSKDLRAAGEAEQRLYALNAWRETPFYTPRERAALQWAEAVTRAVVPDTSYQEAKLQFSDAELIDLTLAVTIINTYNRFNLAFPAVPGTYRPGQFEVPAIQKDSVNA